MAKSGFGGIGVDDFYAGVWEGCFAPLLGGIGDDFSMNVAKQWEQEFYNKQIPGVRKIAMRLSQVLRNDGGVLPVLKKQAKLGLAGKHGNGKQKFSWIHIEDLLRIINHLIEHKELSGSINCTAPKVTTNRLFLKNLRNSVGKKFGLSSPLWMLKIGCFFIGTETELVMKSRNVVPEVLIQNGFQFLFPTIEEALADLIKKQN